jgi:hypothetical protein
MSNCVTIRNLACCAMIVLFSSCGKKFLDIPPESNIPSTSFYKTAADLELALNSAYASLQAAGQYGTANWQVGEVRSDNTYNWDVAGNFPDAEIDQFKESSSNSILNTMWLDHYHGIFLCNVVIDRIRDVDMDANLKKRFIAEALFLRSLMYFNLVRTFGDVPLALKETASVQEGYAQARQPILNVYNQLIADLELAAENLEIAYAGNNLGRPTRGAAKALLGKMYLTKGDYASAAEALQDVINLNTYSLLPDYADLWKISNANNVESIFEVQFKKGGTSTGSSYNNFFAPYGSESYISTRGFAYGRNLPTQSLIDAFETNDRRKNASLAETYSRNGQDVYSPYTIKFRDDPITERDADNNWVVLRYADVLLMYAEALNEIHSGPDNTAYNMINSVRSRAGLDFLQVGMNKEMFIEALVHERQVELAFEGHRWFDLIRMNRAATVMNQHFNGTITVQPYQLLFPIPQSQININPDVITQNEGY